MKNKITHILLTFMISLLSIPATYAETIIVKGIITDANSEPVIGASITDQTKKTNVAVSDIDGKFSIKVDSKAKLVITYVGYTPQELSATNNMKVVLKENPVMIDEVVVVGIGYGEMRKADLTGSIASVGAKDLKKGVVTSTEQLLQGKVAGLNVTQSSSDPAAGAAMRLRGGTSLSANNSPLIVVDGIAGVDINTIQPSDIVSIDVLKDASSAAIYGSRGANGIIIITTKRSSDVEKGQISYNGWMSIGTVAKNMDMLSANQWREYVRENNVQGAIDYGGDTNWLRELERTAISHFHNLSMVSSRKTGGSRASLSYQNTEGIVKENYLQRIAGNASMYQYALNQRLKFDVGVNATYDKYRQPESGFYGIFNYALNQNPTVPVKDELGNYTQITGTNTQNPVELNDNYSSEQTRLRLLAYGKLEFVFFPGLKGVVNGSYEYNSHQDRYYRPSYAYADNNDNGYGRRSLGDYTNWQLEAYLNYEHNWNADNKFNAMAGYSYLYNMYEGFTAERRGFDTDSFMWNNLSAGSDYRVGDASSYKGESKLISFFGRVNYSYKGRYMATATVRSDGSSRFGKNNKWGVFPSASIAWRLSDESFMENTRDWLQNFKVRFGYGLTGNQDGIGEYKSLSLLGTVGGSYYDATTGTWKSSYAPSQNANPDLKWETTSQYNLGLDFTFLHRFSGSIELYYKKTTDLLWTYPVSQPPYLYSSMLANVGNLENKGVELTLNAGILETKDLSWTANLSLAYNKQKITSLSNETFKDSGTPAGQLHGLSGLSNAYTQIVKEGYPTGAFFGPRCQGVNENGELIVENPEENEYLGSAQPKVNLGFSTSVTYKGFDLNVSLYGMFGQKVLNATNMSLYLSSRLPAQNVPDSFLKSGLKGDKIVYCDYWLENGSFLRLQNITLGYTIPNTKKVGIEKVRVYTTVDNICTITGYSGIDPEISTSGLDNPGIDLCNVYPRTRNFILGLNVTF